MHNAAPKISTITCSALQRSPHISHGSALPVSKPRCPAARHFQQPRPGPAPGSSQSGRFENLHSAKAPPAVCTAYVRDDIIQVQLATRSLQLFYLGRPRCTSQPLQPMHSRPLRVVRFSSTTSSGVSWSSPAQTNIRDHSSMLQALPLCMTLVSWGPIYSVSLKFRSASCNAMQSQARRAVDRRSKEHGSPAESASGCSLDDRSSRR